jgi:uncharacterized OsmC-like protein
MKMQARTAINAESFVQTDIDGFQVITEAAVSNGGSGKYPPATRLAVAALLNCSLSSVRYFLEAKGIPTDRLALEFAGNIEEGIYTDMRFDLTLPPELPPRYHRAIENILQTCSEKKIKKKLTEKELVVK